MRKSHKAIFAAALATLFPVSVKAVVVTITFDMVDITVSPTRSGNYVSPNAVSGASLTGTAAAPVLDIPRGYYAHLGLDASISGNGGLGVTGFEVGFNDSNSILERINPFSTVVNSYFKSSAQGGPDGNGGINDLAGISGFNTLVGQTAVPLFGVNGPSELFNSTRIEPFEAGLSGTTVFSVTANQNQFSYATKSNASSSSSSTPYRPKLFSPGIDSISPLPALTINVGSVPEPGIATSMAIAAGGLMSKRKQKR